jgi:hypothetical protein
MLFMSINPYKSCPDLGSEDPGSAIFIPIDVILFLVVICCEYIDISIHTGLRLVLDSSLYPFIINLATGSGGNSMVSDPSSSFPVSKGMKE